MAETITNSLPPLKKNITELTLNSNPKHFKKLSTDQLVLMKSWKEKKSKKKVVGQGINVGSTGPRKFTNKNKRRVLNKHRASEF